MWERSLGPLDVRRGLVSRGLPGKRRAFRMEDAELGALLLDLQGLKGELPRIMPGRGGVAQAQRVQGGMPPILSLSGSSSQAIVLSHILDHFAAPSCDCTMQRKRKCGCTTTNLDKVRKLEMLEPKWPRRETTQLHPPTTPLGFPRQGGFVTPTVALFYPTKPVAMESKSLPPTQW